MTASIAPRRSPASRIGQASPSTPEHRPLDKVEHAFARLGRWRRLSRCYEGSAESARAWLEVAAVGYLFARLRAEPA